MLLQCTLPDSYRGKHTGEDAGEKYAKEVGKTVTRLCSEGKKVGKTISVYNHTVSVTLSVILYSDSLLYG